MTNPVEKCRVTYGSNYREQGGECLEKMKQSETIRDLYKLGKKISIVPALKLKTAFFKDSEKYGWGSKDAYGNSLSKDSLDGNFVISTGSGWAHITGSDFLFRFTALLNIPGLEEYSGDLDSKYSKKSKSLADYLPYADLAFQYAFQDRWFVELGLMYANRDFRWINNINEIGILPLGIYLGFNYLVQGASLRTTLSKLAETGDKFMLASYILFEMSIGTSNVIINRKKYQGQEGPLPLDLRAKIGFSGEQRWGILSLIYALNVSNDALFQGMDISGSLGVYLHFCEEVSFFTKLNGRAELDFVTPKASSINTVSEGTLETGLELRPF